jgi:hypothetical protein
MDILTGDISPLVYRHVIKDDLKTIALDGRLLQLFLDLDGRKSLAQVARKTGMNMTDMRDMIARLIELELVEIVPRSFAVVDKNFVEFLHAELARAIGPIAGVLIEDEMAAMGHSLDRFPAARAAELIEALSREIQREEKKVIFNNNMLIKMKEKSY